MGHDEQVVMNQIGGMALIAAALAADGQSRLSPLETVERGYGRLVERLQALGAKVAKLP